MAKARREPFCLCGRKKDFGEWTTYGGGGYWINPESGDKNFWFAGWVLQRKITERLSLGAELFRQSSDKTSDKATSGFNVGAIYDADEKYHLLMSAGRGLEHVHETNQFSWYIGLLVTD